MGKFAYVTNQRQVQHRLGDRHGQQHGGSHNPRAGAPPSRLAITPNGQFVYVTNLGSPSTPSAISVIATASNKVVKTIAVNSAYGVAITPHGRFVYVGGGGIVSVIATASNKVVATIPVGGLANDLAITPDGRIAYVPVRNSNVWVIYTASNTVIQKINVGNDPTNAAITPQGHYLYVTNEGSNSVSIIATISNKVVGTVSGVFSSPWDVAISRQPAAARNRP